MKMAVYIPLRDGERLDYIDSSDDDDDMYYT